MFFVILKGTRMRIAYLKTFVKLYRTDLQKNLVVIMLKKKFSVC